MPLIKTYEAPALDIRPTETGIDALQQAARRTGAFYQQAAHDYANIGTRLGSAISVAGAEAVRFEENRETTVGAKNFAALVQNKTEQWNQIAATADPNDPTIKRKFLEGLETDLGNFADNGFLTEGGQKWAQAHANQFRQHMFEKTTADMSRLAGEAAHVNTRETINRLSNMAYGDYRSLDFAISTLRSSVEGIIGSSPNLGANAGHVRTTILEDGTEKIVKAAVMGYIERTGQVPPWVTDPKYSKYINGAELKQIQKAAEAQAKTNFLQEKAIEDYRLKQADRAAHAAANKNFTDNVSVDPATGKVIINPNYFQGSLDIAKKNLDAPNASTIARTYLDWGAHELRQQRQRAEPVVSDPAVKADLLSRLGDPNKPTDELQILRAATDEKLSTRDMTLMREMVNKMGPQLMHDPVVHATLAGAAERVGQNLVFDGHERYANFLQTFWPEYLRQKNADTLPPNALDLKDENSLIRKKMKQFEPSPQDRILAHAQKMAGGGLTLSGLPLPGGQTMPPVTSTGGPGNLSKPPTGPLPAKDLLEHGKLYQTSGGLMRWDAKRSVFVSP